MASLLVSCSHTPRHASPPAEVTLDPLSLRIPFGIDLLEEGIDPRWEDLHDIKLQHSEAFGLEREYDPSSTLAACRNSPLEDLPYEACVRFAANAAPDDYPRDAGALSILVVQTQQQGVAQLRVISFGNPRRGGIYPRDFDEQGANYLLGARTILDTLVYFEAERAKQIISSSMEVCSVHTPPVFDIDRPGGPELWSIEVRREHSVCRGVDPGLLRHRPPVWSDLVLEALALFGHTAESIDPLFYRKFGPDERRPWREPNGDR